jgi:hypothetical protein
MQAEDIFSAQGTYRGMRPEDLLLAFRDTVLVGTLAAWNQQAFRQTVIHSYAGHLHWTRPVYNIWARCRGTPPLPEPAQPLRYRLAALPVVANDDRQVFQTLLDELLTHRAGTEHDYLLVGLHENDPLLPVLHRYQGVRYTTRLFVVCWSDGEAMRATLDDRPPYLELGSL